MKSGRPRPLAIEQEFAVDVVLDERDAAFLDQRDELPALLVRHCRAQRIAQRGGQHADPDRMGRERLVEGREIDAALRAGFDLDGKHAEALDQLELAVIRRRLHRNGAGRLDGAGRAAPAGQALKRYRLSAGSVSAASAKIARSSSSSRYSGWCSSVIAA